MSENKYVVFNLAKEKYGIPIESVERILPSQEVTKLPKTPEMVLGVFEIRGQTLPVIDARLRFEMEPNEAARNFVVVINEQGRCALRVDEVDGIITFDESEIDSNPNLTEHQGDDFIFGIGKKNDCLTVLLDTSGVIPKQLRAITESTESYSIAA